MNTKDAVLITILIKIQQVSYRNRSPLKQILTDHSRVVYTRCSLYARALSSSLIPLRLIISSPFYTVFQALKPGS